MRELAEPFADEVHDVRASSPILNLTDLIETEESPVERERMKLALAKGTQGLHEMFDEMLRQEARARRGA